MDVNEISKRMIEYCGYLHHVGMLVDNAEETVKKYEAIPGFGRFASNRSTWTAEEMLEGREITIICATAKILDGTLLEIIEPVQGLCRNSHFEHSIEKRGEGLHHICYGFPRYEDFIKVHNWFIESGCTDVMHGRKRFADGVVSDEFCYIELPAGNLLIELNWTRIKWGY